MKIKCIIDDDNKIKCDEIKKYLEKYRKDFTFPSDDINKEYMVFGIEMRDNIPWYWIYTDIDLAYPYPIRVYSGFYEIIDNRLSKYLEINVKYSNNKNETSFLFKEWNENEYIHWDLLESDNYALEIFEKYRKLMEDEFHYYELDKVHNEIAEKIEENWVICSNKNCNESFEVENKFELIKCEYCKKVQKNPYNLTCTRGG